MFYAAQSCLIGCSPRGCIARAWGCRGCAPSTMGSVMWYRSGKDEKGGVIIEEKMREELQGIGESAAQGEDSTRKGGHSEENGDEKEDGKKEHKGREEGAQNGGRKMTLASDDKGENHHPIIHQDTPFYTLVRKLGERHTLHHSLQPVVIHTIIALLRYHALPCLNLHTLSKHETSTVGIGSGADPGCEYGSGGTTCMIRRERDDKEDQDKRGRVCLNE
ncbi:hypothetical protein DFH09DRAFT_1110936 [Mycena vulgaris]|nr:hypothetical protein DFH09DRAFT_1110936 [Mycena vulgaris]